MANCSNCKYLATEDKPCQNCKKYDLWNEKAEKRGAKILNITATNIITAAESIMFSQIVDRTRKIKKLEEELN